MMYIREKNWTPFKLSLLLSVNACIFVLTSFKSGKLAQYGTKYHKFKITSLTSKLIYLAEISSSRLFNCNKSCKWIQSLTNCIEIVLWRSQTKLVLIARDRVKKKSHESPRSVRDVFCLLFDDCFTAHKQIIFCDKLFLSLYILLLPYFSVMSLPLAATEKHLMTKM